MGGERAGRPVAHQGSNENVRRVLRFHDLKLLPGLWFVQPLILIVPPT
jgi:hypothetical protein